MIDEKVLIERLEERKELHSNLIVYEQKCGTITEEYQQRKAVDVLEYAISIVNQLAEEHKDKMVVVEEIKNPFANVSTVGCFNCDHKDEYIIELEKELEEHNNGWIPVSERLPSKEEVKEWAIFLVTIRVHGKYDIMDFCLCGTDGKWHISEGKEVIAWKRQNPYQPKGE